LKLEATWAIVERYRIPISGYRIIFMASLTVGDWQ
jgi:hypothetical protein